MKRLTAIILALVLLAAGAVSALAEEGSGSGWPTLDMKGLPADMTRWVTSKDFRVQSTSGPGRGYSLSGSYQPRGISAATALYTENEYMLLDLTYGGGRRCVYIPTPYPVVEGELEAAHWTPYPARLAATVDTMYYGPGKYYDEVRKRTRSRFADWAWDDLLEYFDGDLDRIERALEDVWVLVGLPAGARVDVLYEADGWVCIESSGSSIGLARTWVQASQVTAE